MKTISGRNWGSRFWEGVQLSKGWFWLAVNICLSVFTMASIAWAVFPISDKATRIAPAIAGIAIVFLAVLVLIQAPYRGLLKETERAQTSYEKVIEGYRNDLFEAGKKIERLEQKLNNLVK